jgi:hypothetical protein
MSYPHSPRQWGNRKRKNGGKMTIMPKVKRTSFYTAPGSPMGELLRAVAEIMGVQTSKEGWAQEVLRRVLTDWLKDRLKEARQAGKNGKMET